MGHGASPQDIPGCSLYLPLPPTLRVEFKLPTLFCGLACATKRHFSVLGLANQNCFVGLRRGHRAPKPPLPTNTAVCLLTSTPLSAQASPDKYLLFSGFTVCQRHSTLVVFIYTGHLDRPVVRSGSHRQFPQKVVNVSQSGRIVCRSARIFCRWSKTTGVICVSASFSML